MGTRELWERPVSYGAVGATQAADLLRHPPVGYRPFERRKRVGHGEARFEYAWSLALSWGIQRRSGMGVELASAPGHVTEATYKPVSFDSEGVPVAPAMVASGAEVAFGPDGMALLSPGETVTLTVPIGPVKFHAPCRVIYVIDEPNRKGFAYGTLQGHPERGEESFLVERTEDGSVWLTVRAFSRPARWYYWIAYPALRFTQAFYTRRYFRSLSGTLGQ